MEEPQSITHNFSLIHPFTASFCGSSQTGKSTTMLKLIDNIKEMVDFSNVSDLPEIIYIFNTPQKKFNDFKDKAKFYRGWNHDQLRPEKLRQKTNLMIFVDDSVTDAPQNFLREIFTIDSHHRNW